MNNVYPLPPRPKRPRSATRARARRRWQLGWDLKFGRHLHAAFCPSAINRPYLRWDRWDGGGYIGLSWGNGNSDPVWSIDWSWTRR